MFDSAIRFQSMPFHSNSIPNFGVALAVFSLSWNSFVHNKKLSCEMNHTLPAGRSVGRPVCVCVFSHLPIIRNVPTMIECVCVYGIFFPVSFLLAHYRDYAAVICEDYNWS